MPRKLTGANGRQVTIPDGWRGLQGSNGHMVPERPGDRGLHRSDGRMVEVPSGWRALEGSDGRMVAVCPRGRALQGSDGALIASVRDAVVAGSVNVDQERLRDWKQWAGAEADRLDSVLSGQIPPPCAAFGGSRLRRVEPRFT